MTTIRKIIQRDIGEKVEGVVKVFDQSALATEIREYVVTDKIEDELKRIFDTFTHVSETIRRGGASRDVVGIWISGFFGSGTCAMLSRLFGAKLRWPTRPGAAKIAWSGSQSSRKRRPSTADFKRFRKVITRALRAETVTTAS
jgi:hypothetical protein